MKNILKLILPPFFILLFNKLIFLFKKILVNNISTYDNDLIAKVVIEKNIIFRDKLEKTKQLDISTLRTLLSVGITSINLNNKNLNVLDFGGGGGYHYFISKLIINEDVKINWHIVETKSIVNQSHKISNSSLRFFESIEEASIGIEQFDLIIASSSLQYCVNQFEILQKFKNLNPKNIFITRTPFSKNSPFLNKIQFSNLSSNGPGDLPINYKDHTISYPIYIQNIDEFENEFTKGYNLKFKLIEEKNAFIIENSSFDNYGFFYVAINK